MMIVTSPPVLSFKVPWKEDVYKKYVNLLLSKDGGDSVSVNRTISIKEDVISVTLTSGDIACESCVVRFSYFDESRGKKFSSRLMFRTCV
jgi:hypothetical protein